MRRIDLHDVAPAPFINSQDLMADDLREREREVMTRQICRADSALTRAQQPIARTKLEDEDVVAPNPPTMSYVTIKSIPS